MNRERIRFYAGGRLRFIERSDGSWSFDCTDLEAVRSALGEDLLVSFLRCFVWADRLQSLGSFGYRLRAKKDGALTHTRNLYTIALFGGGALYEAADAVEGLEAAGIGPKLAHDADWRRLGKMARRWRRSKLLIKVRNNLAFHAAPTIVRRGLREACSAGERFVVLGGDGTIAGKRSLRLGTDLLMAGMGIRKADTSRLFGIMAHDHREFSELVQRVFFQALKSAGLL